MDISADSFLFDNEQLQKMSDSDTVSQGLAWFKENRVMHAVFAEGRLDTEVEDPERSEAYRGALFYDPDEGVLRAWCDCGANEEHLCAHLTAGLFAYNAQSDEQQRISATEQAIAWRVKRGRTEVQVNPVGNHQDFGVWEASSLQKDDRFAQTYRVSLRSLEERNNCCTCPDFATNQLGTCKHIEGVLHKIRKQRGYKKLLQQGNPKSYIYLDWHCEQAPTIRVKRTLEIPDELRPAIDNFFDASGYFTGQLPEGFFRLSEQLQNQDSIEVGTDAVLYNQRLASKNAQQLRTQAISQQIRASGGQLPGIAAKLYPYQIEGVAFLAANGRALLADDMGLGKTLQAISAASWLFAQASARKILIICPASLKQQWAREIEKFTRHSVQIIGGSPKARSVQYSRGNDFYIINYELVLRDLSVINHTLNPDLVILDEAQRIKNWQTQIATAVKRIESHYAFVLSGTPLENRLEDLYSLMQVVDPHVLGPLWRYYADFHITDERGKVLGYRNLSTLRQRLAPVMLRRDRRLVSDQLPRRIEQRLDIPLTVPQQELHDSALSAAGQLARKAKARPLTPSEQNKLMASLQQARMACNASILVDQDAEENYSPKLDELEAIVTELCVQSGLKMVVFSQWALMTELVEQRLRKIGVESVRLHGGVPTAKRGDLMDRFQNDDAIQVFISTDAGGTGLNLQNASVLLNLDIPWNPAILDQRIARVHRLGQRQPVQVILLVASDSYEEHVMSLVKGKRHLFDNVVDPAAEEDVVGVSRKMLETLTEDLAASGFGDEESAATGSVDTSDLSSNDITDAVGVSSEEIENTTIENQQHNQVDNESDEAVQSCIVQLQEQFGQRIERILANAAGLIVVLDHVTDQDEQKAEVLAVDIQIALIDPRSWRSLQRLGSASPVAESTAVYSLEQEAASPKNRLKQLAQEKLQAAEILMEQGIYKVPLDMLVTALLQASASRAGQEQAPNTQEAAIWLYAEALPNQWLQAEDVAVISRALAFTQAPEVPLPLLGGLLDDVRRFIDKT